MNAIDTWETWLERRADQDDGDQEDEGMKRPNEAIEMLWRGDYLERYEREVLAAYIEQLEGRVAEQGDVIIQLRAELADMNNKLTHMLH